MVISIYFRGIFLLGFTEKKRVFFVIFTHGLESFVLGGQFVICADECGVYC